MPKVTITDKKKKKQQGGVVVDATKPPVEQEPDIIRDQDTGEPTFFRGPSGGFFPIDPKLGANTGRLKPQQQAFAREGITQQKQEQERQKLKFQQLEDQGLLPPEQAPERVDLEVQGAADTGIPVVGPSIDAISNLNKLGIRKGLIGGGVGNLISQEQLQDPELRKRLIRNEIDERMFKKVEKDLSEMGIISEAVGLSKIPFGIGDAIEKFTKIPSEDVDSLVEQIKQVESRASAMTDAASQGELGDTTQVLIKLRDMNNEVAELESQIRFLSILSPEIQADPEQINIIEGEILKTRETIFESQQRAAEGAIITPTENNLFLTLQNLRNERR